MPRKSQRRLTKTLIDQAQPGTIVWDSELPGFGVRVTKAGTKSFIVQFRTRSGAQGRLTIGGFPTLTVDQARDLARTELSSVKKGDNPSSARRALRNAPTLAWLSDHYCDEYGPASNLRPRTIADARHLLTKYARPALGSRKVAEVRTPDVRNLHGAVRSEAGVYQANRLLAVLSKMFNLSVELELRATNPCKGIVKFHEDQRWRNFSQDEVDRILSACSRYQLQNPANAIRLLLFTGARLQELLKAEWQQFDLNAGIWEKPSAHTKTKRRHRLALAGPALTLLTEMRASDPGGRFLFPGESVAAVKDTSEELARPRRDLKRVWDWIRREAQLEDARLHDLRRTTASFMLMEQVPLATIGSALGHTQVSTTARYARLQPDAQRDGLRRAGERMTSARP